MRCLTKISTRRAAAILGLLLAGAVRLPAAYPILSRALFWEPYAFDEATVALYHLDERAATPATEDLDVLALTGDQALIKDDATSSTGVRNENPVGAAGALRGDATLAGEGRFGGGLHFGGGDGMLVAGDAGRIDDRTLEFWLKLDELPAREATLACFYTKNPKVGTQPVRLVVRPDGALQVVWRGAAMPVADFKCAAGQWVHLALSWGLAWPRSNTVRLSVNGRNVWQHQSKDSIGPECALGSFLIGNDPAGKEGFKGTVDEIRFSKSFRELLANELTWPQPDRKIADTPGQPFFRDAADLLFRAGFNKDLKADRCAPNTQSPDYIVSKADESLTPAKVRLMFPSGVEGAALMIGEESLSPVYKGEGNLNPARGSLAFWLQPLNWDNHTRDNRYDAVPPTTFGLFQIDGEYMEGSYDRNFRRTGPLVEFNIVLHMDEGVDNPVDFEPGRWTHIVMTWEGTAFTYYVNGRRRDPGGSWTLQLPIYPGHDPRQPPQPDWWLNAKPQAIRFGTRTYWDQLKQPAPRSAIDDFRVYRRALAPSEIANLARFYDPREAPAPLPAMDMAMTYNGVSGRVIVDTVPLMAAYTNAVEAAVQLTRAGAASPVGTGVIKLDERKQGRVEVQTPPLDFATYRVQADIRDAAGRSLGNAEQSFTRTAPPWWQNRLGVSDKVMPDWPALQVAGNVIQVAERQITLGPSGLPERIVAVGEDVLAGPVTLEAASEGKPLPLAAAGKADVKASSQVRADARGHLAGGGLDIGIESYTEFDGMMWFTVEVSGAAVLDSLTLRVPLKPDSAELMHWWSGSERGFRDPKVVHIGALPTTPGVLFRSNDTNVLAKASTMRGSFIPYLLLTGNRRGLAWFAENDRGWTQSDETPAVSVERSEKAVTLVLRLVTAPLKIDTPRRIAFGLQPTPVKSLDKLWRQYPGYSNVYSDTFCGNNLKGRDGPATFSLYPEDSWEAVKRRIDGEGLGAGAAGMKGLHLGRLAALAKAGVTNPPPQTLTVPGLYWDMQWNGIPPSLTHTREWAETWALDYQYYTPEFVDFCSWAWNDWIEKTDKFVQGAYIDDCWGARSAKAGGPTAYTLPDGHVQPGFQFLGPRERFKRMRQISWAQGVWPHITAHTTHTFFVPYHAFFDLILDGEDFYSTPAGQTDFIDHWPLDRMRFMNSAKWGLVTTWLGWCGNSLKTDNWPAWTFRQQRAYTANLALHDIAWGFDAKVKTDFGFGEPDTVFVPYWDSHGLATPERADVKVCAWQRPGKCLVMLVNVSSNRQEVAVKLDRQAMGFGAGSAATLKLTDADPQLLTYFPEDVTTLVAPTAPDYDEKMKAPNVSVESLTLEEKAVDLPTAERRAKDPDGVFAWKDGTLTCPVRRHDFRLFVIE